MVEHTTTLKELGNEYKGTYSVKDNSARGRKEVSFYNLEVGMEVLIDNYFTLIIEEEGEETMEERILEVIKEMEDEEIVSLWNNYCYESSNYDDEIYNQCGIEEYIDSCDDKMSLLNRFYFGHDEGDENSSANPNRNYFYFNGYGNIVSFDYVTNQYADYYFQGPIDIDDLIGFIIENENSFYNDDIQAILDED